MARAYSEDLRERVVAAVGDGQSCRQVAVVFRVSVASVVKWSQRARETGSAVARPQGGRPARAWRGGSARYAVALPAGGRDQLQKKPCSPVSRIDLTSPAGGPGGRSTRTVSIPAVWCSSTRPGPRPT